MSMDSSVFDALKGLVSNRVYPGIAPAGTTRPYITYQRIGGVGVNFVDATTVPSKKNARFQINVWGDTRAHVSTLSGQVEDALRVVTTLQTTVLNAPIDVYEEDTKMHGTIQDFSFWQ